MFAAVVRPAADIRRGTYAGKKRNAAGHFSAGNAAAADGKSPGHSNTLRPH